MSEIKDSEIYPKFEFRLTHKEKQWLIRELDCLKEKFGADGQAINKNDLLVAALRHGFRYLQERQKICDAQV
jgi:hypothetical protein